MIYSVVGAFEVPDDWPPSDLKNLLLHGLKLPTIAPQVKIVVFDIEESDDPSLD